MGSGNIRNHRAMLPAHGQTPEHRISSRRQYPPIPPRQSAYTPPQPLTKAEIYQKIGRKGQDFKNKP